MPLTLSSPVVAIDRKLALRRSGFRTKGPEARDVLAGAFDIRTVGDLLHHYPRRYTAPPPVETIRGLKIGAYATVIASVRKVTKRQTRQRRSMVTVTITDGTGSLALPFFNHPWAATMYREVELLRGDAQDLVHTGRITPVHPASEGVTTRTIRELIWKAIEALPSQPDPMPAQVIDAEALSSWDEALRRIHFPEDDAQLAAARERLKFDELFTLELGVGFRKRRLARDRSGVAHNPDGPLTAALRRNLPFAPTRAQGRA